MSVASRLLIAALTLLLPVLLWLASVGPYASTRPIRAVKLDLGHPDVLIDSQSLSSLPRDILKQPLLGDVLSQDFVFYYEQNPERALLAGTLKRLAFEHALTLPDRVLDALLDRPATLALWRGHDGAPRHWMLLIENGTFNWAIEAAARIALNDTQLSRAGELPLDTGRVPLYALRLNDRHTLLLAFHGPRLLVFSSPGMVLGQDTPSRRIGMRFPEPPDTPTRIAATLLAGHKALLYRAFDLGAPTERHRMTVSADFLTFGYQPFFPALSAMSGSFDGQQWHARLRADLDEIDPGNGVWSALPGESAACVALPVRWQALDPIVARVVQPASDTSALAALHGQLGLCWSARSHLATPLAVSAIHDGRAQKTRDDFGRLFETLVGAAEPFHPNKHFPVAVTVAGDSTRWRRTVSSAYGDRPASQAPNAALLAAHAYFEVSLLTTDDWLAASPDAGLVTLAGTVFNHQRASASEGLPSGPGRVLARVRPAELAQLLRTDMLQVVRPDREPIFHGIAQEQLLPRLEVLAKQAPFDLLAESAGAGLRWHPLRWQTRGLQ